MDNKDLITRFAEDCFRFEALHQEIDGLIADADSEVLAYEYEDLSNQAAEVVLKLSANGNNLGEHFYRYYVERLEYIIDYFRALLDYGEIPLAEDEQDELDDEKARAYRGLGEFFATPAEVRFEGNPADCAFPKIPTFYINNREIQLPLPAKDEENAATDEAAAVEEDDSEDEQSDEVDNENDTQAAESDEAADDTAAGAPLSPCKKPFGLLGFLGLNRLSSEDRERVRDTFVMWYDINEVIGRNPEDPNLFPAAEILEFKENAFSEFEYDIEFGKEHLILVDEQEIRAAIEDAIDAIPGFRDSEKFKNLIELCPSYKEIEQ